MLVEEIYENNFLIIYENFPVQKSKILHQQLGTSPPHHLASVGWDYPLWLQVTIKVEIGASFVL